MAVFLRATAELDKASALTRAVETGEGRFEVSVQQLESVDGSPFAYWVSDALRRVFVENEALRHGSRAVKQGLASADDFRFVRLSWEAPAPLRGSRWAPFVKGGRRSPFYADVPTCIDWFRRGALIRASLNDRGETRSNIRMLASTEADFFGRPGITWPLRGIHFSGQAVPADTIFSNAGKMAFDTDPAVLLAVMNSVPFDALVAFYAGKVGGVQYEVGLIGRVPFPNIDEDSDISLRRAARSGWSFQRSCDAATEPSLAFVLPATVQVSGNSLHSRADHWSNRISGSEVEVDQVLAKIDELCFDLYQISDVDRRSITDGLGTVGDAQESTVDDPESLGEDATAADATGLAAGLVSWCVGVGVGRFDVRLATGEREWPSEPDPFDPLPVCSPGMLTGEDGLPLDTPPEGYPVEVSAVLVDDPGHPLDITGRVRSVFETVLDDPDAWWADVGEALGAKRAEISSWLSKGFFDHHLKTYSKSRRKAPILWPLGTASGSYTVWLYAHRVTSDSLFRVLNDVVTPKLSVERRSLSELVQDAGPNPSTSQRKAMDGQEKLVGELEDLVGQLTAVAPLWHPDLNDGVVIVLAPLWRLFAHHKPWSKELRKHWDSLVAGAYDWAQLAMSLWPERVVPKCGEDRSLAIAHGLEDVFWAQDDDNPDKWHPRQTPTIPIDRLIEDRTDPATKAALEDTT